jgi:hypothetical protein
MSVQKSKKNNQLKQERKLALRQFERCHPPQIHNPRIQRSCVAMMNTSSLDSFPFTAAHLLGLLCCAKTSTTSAYLMQAVRLDRVRIWGQPPSYDSGVYTSPVAIEWTSDSSQILSSGKCVSDTSVNRTDTPYVDSKPPKGTMAAWFQNAQASPSVTLCNLTASARALVYIDFSYVLMTSEPPVAGPALVAATAGGVGGVSPGAYFSIMAPYNTLPSFWSFVRYSHLILYKNSLLLLSGCYTSSDKLKTSWQRPLLKVYRCIPDGIGKVVE